MHGTCLRAVTSTSKPVVAVCAAMPYQAGFRRLLTLAW